MCSRSHRQPQRCCVFCFGSSLHQPSSFITSTVMCSYFFGSQGVHCAAHSILPAWLVFEMASSSFRAVTLLCGASLTAAVCPPADFSTAQNFDLNSYVAGRWYIQEQMPTNYLPESQNYCVYAEYSLGHHFWGYEVTVHNHAEDVAEPHAAHDSGRYLCAKVVDEASGKLEVAPCFLPAFFAGPYWVVDYDETAGYALISGGAPTHETAGRMAPRGPAPTMQASGSSHGSRPVTRRL